MANQTLDVSPDHRQQIVEIVGNAAGDLADGFHLLGLPQPHLGGALLGEVAGHLGEARQRTRLVVNGIDDDARPEPAAIFAYAPALGLVGAALRRRGDRLVRNAGPSILVRVELREVLAEDLVSGVSL